MRQNKLKLATNKEKKKKKEKNSLYRYICDMYSPFKLTSLGFWCISRYISAYLLFQKKDINS